MFMGTNVFAFKRALAPDRKSTTSELQSRQYLVCRLLLEKKKHTSELQLRQYIVCRLLLEKKDNKRYIRALSYDHDTVHVENARETSCTDHSTVKLYISL